MTRCGIPNSRPITVPAVNLGKELAGHKPVGAANEFVGQPLIKFGTGRFIEPCVQQFKKAFPLFGIHNRLKNAYFAVEYGIAATNDAMISPPSQGPLLADRVDVSPGMPQAQAQRRRPSILPRERAARYLEVWGPHRRDVVHRQTRGEGW